MTIFAWVIWILVSLFLCTVGFMLVYARTDSAVKSLIGILVGAIISFMIFTGLRWYYSSTASGVRALKSQESDLERGIDRWVGVYDVNGELIKEYHGKFDIEYDGNRILFDDENNLRHIIYYPTGTVIIDEIAN